MSFIENHTFFLKDFLRQNMPLNRSNLLLDGSNPLCFSTFSTIFNPLCSILISFTYSLPQFPENFFVDDTIDMSCIQVLWNSIEIFNFVRFFSYMYFKVSTHNKIGNTEGWNSYFDTFFIIFSTVWTLKSLPNGTHYKKNFTAVEAPDTWLATKITETHP